MMRCDLRCRHILIRVPVGSLRLSGCKSSNASTLWIGSAVTTRCVRNGASDRK
jgi:hypothetical protein